MSKSLGRGWSGADFHHTQDLKESRDGPHCGVDFIGRWHVVQTPGDFNC